MQSKWPKLLTHHIPTRDNSIIAGWYSENKNFKDRLCQNNWTPFAVIYVLIALITMPTIAFCLFLGFQYTIKLIEKLKY